MYIFCNKPCLGVVEIHGENSSHWLEFTAPSPHVFPQSQQAPLGLAHGGGGGGSTISGGASGGGGGAFSACHDCPMKITLVPGCLGYIGYGDEILPNHVGIVEWKVRGCFSWKKIPHVTLFVYHQVLWCWSWKVMISYIHTHMYIYIISGRSKKTAIKKKLLKT